MALTFEVNKDKSVTIYNDGTVFSHQFDDPDVEGYDAFETKARAEEWAKKAIAKYAAEMAAEQKAAEEANAAAAAELARQLATVEAEAAAFAGAEAEAAADSKESPK
jgi:hypothetical protein